MSSWLFVANPIGKAYGLTLGTRVKVSQILNLDIKNSSSSSSSSKNKSFNGKVQFFDKGGSSDHQILKGSICQPSCLMDKAFISLFDDQELKISEGHFYGSLECISKIASRYVVVLLQVAWLV